ncbi:hypothetical protein KFZ70_10755 [Tamlana fucoidanivorans]|uniref:Lipoprotein n=1 Tax=Allotamlana fucoidanivorans TaxID=2583814 RepID=A0A5C4SNA7_9FLAO|nr:hypothetical protein [Tamlana fucoidanivorans]TNJ45659.1 hypothetical protein FGF67_04570 [Tamlana fucoidanivorans]
MMIRKITKNLTISGLLSLLFMACGKDKVVLLPEINQAKTTQIQDVSAAYLFYDESQPDSVELNRRNLISTTNWLINVDKRLSLNQAIPHIKFLQEKKSKSSHKNELAKNYFTCNDLIIKNLGFLEFTNINYVINTLNKSTTQVSKNIKPINFDANGDIFILNPNAKPFVTLSNKATLIEDLKRIDSTGFVWSLRFDKKLSFQEYISYKALIEKAQIQNASISNEEFIDD